MTPEAAERSLAQGLAYLHALFAAYVARAEGSEVKTAEPLPVFPESDSLLLRLAVRLRLSPFERDLLLLCTAVELDAGIAQLCARVQSAGGAEPARVLPTFSLALSLLPEGHWTALHPEAPLRRYGLLRLIGNDGDNKDALTLTPLRIEEAVLHYLLGLPPADDRLRPWVEWLSPLPSSAAEAVPAALRASLARLEQAWTPGAAPRLAVLAGGDESARREIARRACEMVALLPLALLLPLSPPERDGVIRLWEREAVLAPNQALLLEIGDETEIGPNRDILAALLRRITALPGRLLLAVGERLLPLVTNLLSQNRPYVLVEATRADRNEQRDTWHRVLATSGIDTFDREETNRITERLVGQFALGVGQIESVGASVLLPGVSPKIIPAPEKVAEQLWDRCRIAARPRLEELAERVETKASWDDLILPAGAQQLLQDVVAHVRARVVVSDHWGFGKRSSRGLGISALFSGPSGTGKTLAAEVLAGELRLDLYRIDLSALVSKYIGETEKNLRRVFDAAEAGGALLLFDEADALFGKRSDVKDSHDRYANIEVSYLLQRMENYQGLAILTTNLKGAMDTAFLRRLRFAVSFPFPDVVQRARMWARAFPPETPTAGVVPQTLAQLHIAGGNIRSMALYAASLAASQGEPVQMRHLLRAARAEYAKLEKPLTDAEVEGWLENGTKGPGETR